MYGNTDAGHQHQTRQRDVHLHRELTRAADVDHEFRSRKMKTGENTITRILPQVQRNASQFRIVRRLRFPFRSPPRQAGPATPPGRLQSSGLRNRPCLSLRKSLLLRRHQHRVDDVNRAVRRGDVRRRDISLAIQRHFAVHYLDRDLAAFERRDFGLTRHLR
jgi:hypothetical protein